VLVSLQALVVLSGKNLHEATPVKRKIFSLSKAGLSIAAVFSVLK
jgi:hypothetical protein